MTNKEQAERIRINVMEFYPGMSLERFQTVFSFFVEYNSEAIEGRLETNANGELIAPLYGRTLFDAYQAARTIQEKNPELPFPPRDGYGLQDWARDGLSKGNAEPEKPTEPKTAEIDNPCWHSRDFTSVKWYGKEYTFNTTQSKIMKLLWEAWESPTQIGVKENVIGGAVNTYSKKYRVRNSFRRTNKTHPAWGTMIKHKGNGVFFLWDILSNGVGQKII